MGVFETTRTLPVVVRDLAPVAQDLMQHFEAQGFQVHSEETITRGWHVSITKGALFASIMGNQASLNIELEPSSLGVIVRAGVGVFGKQVLPTLVTYFIAAPVLLAQVWGMVKQSKLDDEALAAVERSLAARGTVVAAPAVGGEAAPVIGAAFCTACGAKLFSPASRFCPQCGAKQVPA